jgi:glycosyltransferase involved in cell wall biosynthesis
MTNQCNIKKAMPDMPLVSIMIITYNQVDFIHETLISALEQDYKNLEVVVADDGSTDGTDKIILQYAEQYPGRLVPVVGGPNLGITGNCNRALKACNGVYVALQGGDDTLLPNKISKQIEWFSQNESAVLCGHKLYVINSISEVTGTHTMKKVAGYGVSKWLKYGTLYGGTSIMVKNKHIPKYGFDDRISTSSDWKFYIDVIKSDKNYYGYVDEYLACYRIHENNITKDKIRTMKDVEITLDILSSEFSSDKFSLRIGKAYILHYGKGYQCIEKGKYRESIPFLLESIKLWPLQLKAYVRLLQASLLIFNDRFR